MITNEMIAAGVLECNNGRGISESTKDFVQRILAASMKVAPPISKDDFYEIYYTGFVDGGQDDYSSRDDAYKNYLEEQNEG